MPTRILLADRQRAHRIDSARLCEAAAALAETLWPDPVEISITLLGRRAMAAANRTHRGCLGPTDQISFPLADGPPAPDGVAMVGDLLICPGVIASQCTDPPPDGHRSTGTPGRELALVLCHGLLHLRGHTHDSPADKAAMIAEERRLFETCVDRLEGAWAT